MNRCLTITVWAYLLGVLLAWLMIGYAGDRWWVATLMLFGPRWLYALPMLVLVPLVVWRRRRLLWVLLPASCICLFPIGGFCVPTLGRTPVGEQQIRVLTFNAFGWEGGAEPLGELIRAIQPDIVAVQEHYGPMPDIWPQGWQVRTTNSLIIASPHPLLGPTAHHRIRNNRADAMCCVVDTPKGPVRFANVHLLSPRDGIEAVLSRSTLLRPSESDRLVDVIRFRDGQARDVRHFVCDGFGAEIVAGDFNMPIESAIYRAHWRDLRNAFGLVGWGLGFTKRSAIPGLTYGARIDQIVTTGQWSPVRCWVERDLGSDHLPLVADLVGE